MRNKYFILAVTFLCMLLGQQSYGQDYFNNSTIDNLVAGLLNLNPDITVYNGGDEYINAINNDADPTNDFVDLNGDGIINAASDNFGYQYTVNTLNLPKTISETDLMNILESSVQLMEVEVNGGNQYTFGPSEVGYNEAYVGEIDGVYYDAVNSIWTGPLESTSSGGSSGSNTTTPQSSKISNKLTELLKAAGILNLVINPVTKPVIVTRALVSYSIITGLSDSSCNGTPGGCQSWLNSNYIGATTSIDKATIQRQKGVEPIDAVDLAAFNHDVAYDNLGAAGMSGALLDLNTLQADKDLLAASYNVIDMYSNGSIDPITGQAVSLETRERALLVIAAFEIVVTEKELRN